MITPHPFQLDVIDAVRNFRRRCVLIVLPTGGGKTIVASEIVRQAEHKHVLFIAHRRELIFQARDKLAMLGVKAGVILAGVALDRTRGVQVGSVQTVTRRGERPPADILFIDEAHHVPARTYRQIINDYPDARVIGLTATPCRRDNRGLGNVFEEMIEGPQVAELIKQGHLVGTKVFAPSRPDLVGVHVRHGDYVEGELAERMDRAELVGDIISHWCRLSERRKTVVFATSVAHSIHLKEEFVKAGVKAEHIDGSTPKGERDETLARLASGDLEVVTNCLVLTEGYDLPDLGCIVLARPTKSMGLFRQMVGRGLRPAKGKEHCLVLDHAGAVFMHGFTEDPVVWTLKTDEKAQTPAQERRELKPSNRLLECSQCQAIRTVDEPCPHCGFMPKRPAEYLHVHDGELQHIDRQGVIRPEPRTMAEKQDFFLGLRHIAIARGNKPGVAAYRYKDRFGEFPPRHWNALSPKQPSAEVIAWDRHCCIRYAKAKQRVGANA